MGKTWLVVVSLAVAVAMLEVGLRALAPAHLNGGASSRFELDPDVIYRLRPRITVSWSTSEFTETAHTNALALRGPEVSPKRSGERRILAIGDSFTYGHGVQDDETYPAVLQALLRADAQDVTVLNAGVPGYSTDQSYASFLSHGSALAPDLLLVGIHCSDISDNYESPLYDVRDGRLVRRDARHSRLYQVGSILGGLPTLLQRSRVFDIVLASIDWHASAAELPAVPDLDAWSREKIRLEVLDLHARGGERAMQVAVMLMPCKKALLADAQDPYGSLPDELGAAGVPVLVTAAALRRAHGDLAPLFFRTDPHLNVDGNRALAAVVADFVRDQTRLPSGAGRSQAQTTPRHDR